MDCCLTPSSCQEHVTFLWDDNNICVVLHQDAHLDLHSAILLKQQSVDRYVAALRLIIVIQIQHIISLLLLWVLSGEVANTNLAVFGLILLVLELIIFPTQGEHVTYYTVNRVLSSPDKQSMITIDVHLLLFSLFFLCINLMLRTYVFRNNLRQAKDTIQHTMITL